MNCPNCGAAIKEGKFCNYCGAKLPEEAKIDIKKRDFKIHINNESSVRKAEIAQQAEERRAEQVLKTMKEVNERRKQSDKTLIIVSIIVFAFFIIMFLLNK